MKKDDFDKFAYFVRLYRGNGNGDVTYITAVSGNYLEWDETKQPLAMSQKRAKDVLFALRVNFETAEIVYERVCNVYQRKCGITAWLNERLEVARQNNKDE